MTVWTETALRAEIEYRHQELRRAFGRRARSHRRAPAQPAPVVRLPRQRSAGPGERRIPEGGGAARCA